MKSVLTMKKILAIILCALAVAGCRQEGKEEAALQLRQLRDSLDLVIAQKDNEINDMMQTFNDIEDGFREISEAEGRVSLAKKGEGATSKARIRENLQFIQQTMLQNRELIGKLRQQLRQSSVRGEQLQRTLENLTSQLSTKEAALQALRAELDAKDIHIAALDETIADLNSDMANLQQEGARKDETITQQDQQLHTAWYVFGTKSELREQNILKDGKVLQANFNRDYFTKIDTRIDREIRLYSKSADLLTPHPTNSYTLERDANRQYILRITDPQLFWSTSRYLVIQVK